ncbi:carboxypeptidase-like regulatory domain-containing protein [Marinifilum caeruleilacunae]|uniref:Carboxypeptidase-like regulatory domain-containing protein n=1 Tax=Marinifilum caeruleilacunae TaxID=2499076 RepID=A0ABX1WR72_9BACT|nr:carboxypeptidase-like regulatory domain-containing protein [Marinifilum caeruleilacunae]NOU58516.1 hypothetical protein [Marinifilum caeruleilacunae]
MTKKLLLILIILFASSIAFAQVEIKGKVILKEENAELPGVSIIEKGTDNSTTTDLDGNFTISVSKPDAILIFSFVGIRTKEVKLKNETELLVFLKSDCLMDTFDHQYIGILASSGAVHTPFGGQFELSFPPFFYSTTLKTAINYQTNKRDNEFLNSQIEFDHVIFECDFQMDLKWYYRKVTFENEFNATAYSLESHFLLDVLNFDSFYNVGFITGYGELSFRPIEADRKEVLSGPVIGVVADIGKPLYSNVFAKAAIYKDMVEYQAQIRFDYKKLAAFVNFYRLNSFTEVSLGFGINTGYRSSRHRR